jgi:hypothetical protein
LQEPIWCLSRKEAKERNLRAVCNDSVLNHRIVINIEEVVKRGITDYAIEVLAHEIGHHIFQQNLYDILLNEFVCIAPGIEDRAYGI